MRIKKSNFGAFVGVAAVMAIVSAAYAAALPMDTQLTKVSLSSGSANKLNTACHRLAFEFGIGDPEVQKRLAVECNQGDPGDCVNVRKITGGKALSPFKDILKCGGRDD